jgi:chemotaxis protein methyltransferase CheR
MGDQACVEFLQWCLPRLRMRWNGFRRVRGQVCKRLGRRLRELGLADLGAYRRRLEADETEWAILDNLCRVTISRFFRDRGFYETLEQEVLPGIAAEALAAGEGRLEVWSAGCASGEEPYSVSLLWHGRLADRFPGLEIRVTATEADPVLLARAATARYQPGSLREVPADLRSAAFEPRGDEFLLDDAFRRGVTFHEQDIRHEAPGGPFRLVLCRNLAFTYFDEPLQLETLRRFAAAMSPGGVLAVGSHERLPDGATGAGFSAMPNRPTCYRRM